jgi:predicted NUDIX family phosphoesterase
MIKQENIMVVPRESLFTYTPSNAFYDDFKEETIENIIKKNHFHFRPDAELDETIKQIIPYIYFKFESRIFVMLRKKGHVLGEVYSLGIGGHIRQEDMKDSVNIISWGMREFYEEVDYLGNCEMKIVGFINDDTNSVGRVHFGIVIEAVGDSSDIKIIDEHEDGFLMEICEIKKNYEKLEPWSKIIFDSILYKDL